MRPVVYSGFKIAILFTQPTPEQRITSGLMKPCNVIEGKTEARPDGPADRERDDVYVEKALITNQSRIIRKILSQLSIC